MLVNLQTIIAMAEKGEYCIPAFNVYNIETAMGVMDAAEAANAPVIIQIYPRLIKEEIGFYICPSVVAAARRSKVPVCFHLDHGPSRLEVVRALRWGCSGIMFDGSAEPLEENISRTRSMVEICGAVGIGVEGELGHVGSVTDDTMGEFTDPKEAARFVRETGVVCLAVLIGNAHGHYRKKPCLDIERIKAIREAADGIPLVLHGGSGIPDGQVRAAIKAGIRKMNIATDICCVFADAVKRALDDPGRSLAVDQLMKKPIEAVKAFALEKIALTGASEKANGMMTYE